MSLSNQDVADVINTRFEPAWESVRDVPHVTIDFGGETVVRRTLHGNIATFVCAPDGAVIDVIPGLYDATTYRARLDEALALHTTYTSWPAADRAQLLRQQHAAAPFRRLLRGGNLRLLSKSGIELPTEELVGGAGGGAASKSEIERPTEIVVVPGEEQPTRPLPRGAGSKGAMELPVERAIAPPSPETRVAELYSTSKFRAEAPVERVLVASDGTRVDLELLERDTKHNEDVRRPQISAILAEDGAHTVESLTRRIYRDVLHADLDDPYLGLGDTLFKTYPFER